MVAQIDGIMQNSADLGFKHAHLPSPRPGRCVVQQQLRAAGDRPYAWVRSAAVGDRRRSFPRAEAARLDQCHADVERTTTPLTGHIAYNTSPSFRLVDINGNTEPLSGWSNYSSVNPVLPEVHTHINNVVNDIATNYDVDGIHLDYIRFVPGDALNTTRLPHDPISHQMFFNATGLNGGDQANFQAYKSFVRPDYRPRGVDQAYSRCGRGYRKPADRVDGVGVA